MWKTHIFVVFLSLVRIPRKQPSKTKVVLIQLKAKLHLRRRITMNHDCIQFNFATFHSIPENTAFFPLLFSSSYLSLSQFLLCPIETVHFRFSFQLQQQNVDNGKKERTLKISGKRIRLESLFLCVDPVSFLSFSLCALLSNGQTNRMSRNCWRTILLLVCDSLHTAHCVFKANKFC